MSGTDEGDGQRGDGRPMLIIGQDVPDVEDTTPEQLRLQAEAAQREIERKAEEAHARIERERAEAQRQLEEREEQLRRELARREAELDRTQRTLYRRESKLRARSGSTKKRLVEPVPTPPLWRRGLRGSPWAGALAVLGAAGLIVTAASMPLPPSEQRLAELEGLDRARALWLASSGATTEAFVLRMAGEDVPSEGTPEHLRLAQEALAAMPPVDDTFLRSYAEDTLGRLTLRAPQFLDPGTSEARALTLWKETAEQLDSVVSQGDVRRFKEDMVAGAGPAVAGGVLAVLAVGGLLWMAFRTRSGTTVLLVGGATALTVATFVVLLAGTADGPLGEAVDAHDRTNLFLANAHDEITDDLTTAYGINPSTPGLGDDYWTDRPYWIDPDDASVDPYLQARIELGRATIDDDDVRDEAVDLAAAGRALLEQQLGVQEQQRAVLITELRGAGAPRGVVLPLAGGAVLLAGAAVLTSRGREEET